MTLTKKKPLELSESGPTQGNLLFTASCTLDLEAAKDDSSPGALPRFRMVAYTGTPMRIGGWLWKVASERSLLGVPGRPKGLQEVSHGPEGVPYVRPETEDGIFFEGAETSAADLINEPSDQHPDSDYLIRPSTEDGIFSLVDSRLAELPIWVTPGGPKPQPDPCPDCPPCPEVCPPDHMKLTAKERELIEFIRSQQAETSRFGDLIKNIDWVALARQVIEIIKLFQSLSPTDT